MIQLDLFARPAPARRPDPSDPEIWEAVFNPDGMPRLERLLEGRHADDTAAKLADVRGFRPPDRYVVNERTGLGSNKWAGVLITLERRFSQEVAA